jgi:hypothetical protein
VFTSRTDNVGHHRTIQAAVKAAVSKALQLALALDRPHMSPAAAGDRTAGAVMQPASGSSSSSSNGTGNGAGGEAGNGCGPEQQGADNQQPAVPQPPHTVRLTALSLSDFQLPLAAPVTTGAGSATRDGLLLEVRWRAAGGRSGTAIGEISPLPGGQGHCHLLASFNCNEVI